eukprot:gnl/TRDRNA2_/TRDRNA2_179686_c0_seq1.p1 gnl/TRDRNA2_/TRDRNA2_179686_c0~~gnl/TRDRNA2_/TRDRNA2_179686_c0_seq1.p1  ORF type:complete len:110 (+),score=22.80 gnl/TRDRNA2_/TRDRNA2_179686_c0_seq1:89-418(+)
MLTMSRLALLLLLVASATPSHASLLKTRASRASMADLLVAARHQQNPITVPEHGFDGRMIKHETMMSATEDWTQEYGPKEEERYTESYSARSQVSAAVGLVAMLAAARL